MPTLEEHPPPPSSSKVRRLAQDAAEAAQVRAYQTHPDVVAMQVERVRTQVDRLMWTGIILGVGFTMTNVQSFAAAGSPMWSLQWFAAWLLDPMVSLVLVAVLIAEQITGRYQVKTGKWPRRTKVFAFLATYTMNTWQSWAVHHPSAIVLHSVPPVLVYCVAETAPALRDRLTEAVVRAASAATAAVATSGAAPAVEQDSPRQGDAGQNGAAPTTAPTATAANHPGAVGPAETTPAETTRSETTPAVATRPDIADPADANPTEDTTAVATPAVPVPGGADAATTTTAVPPAGDDGRQPTATTGSRSRAPRRDRTSGTGPRQRKPTSRSAKPRAGSAPSRPRTMDELRLELARAVANADVEVNPSSTESIRRTLRIGRERAAALRDEWSATPIEIDAPLLHAVAEDQDDEGAA